VKVIFLHGVECMKKDTAELLVAIKSAAKHGKTCWIGQGAVVAAVADGAPLVYGNPKEVTTGGQVAIEVEVNTTGLENEFELAEKTLADIEKERLAKLNTPVVTPVPGTDAGGEVAGVTVVSEIAPTV
jgi:hypothetical protein